MSTKPTSVGRATQRRPKTSTDTIELTLGAKLKLLRRTARLSQVAIGAQGFVSTPGWIKIENGQRQASEALLTKFVSFMVEEKVIHARHKEAMVTELCALKFIHDRRDFLRQMARDFYKNLPPIMLLTALPEAEE